MTRRSPAVTTSTLAANPAAEAGGAGDAAQEDAAGTQGADNAQDGGEEAAATQASHPPEDAPQGGAEAPRTRGRGGRPRLVRAGDGAPAPRQVQGVELSDDELQDLGALTRMALKRDIPLPELVAALEKQIAAYHKAMY